MSFSQHFQPPQYQYPQYAQYPQQYSQHQGHAAQALYQHPPPVPQAQNSRHLQYMTQPSLPTTGLMRSISPTSSRSSLSSHSNRSSGSTHSSFSSVDKASGRILFIGDLSYFCTENDLLPLLTPYGNVLNIALRRGLDGQSLLFGFAVMDSAQSALRACQELNNIPFMGRNIKIHISTNDRSKVGSKENHDVPRVHFSFLNKNPNIFVNESYLRQFFSHFGLVTDVSIKKAAAEGKSQTGYGFIFYREAQHAINAQRALQGKIVDDITFDCHAVIPQNPFVQRNQGIPSNQSSSWPPDQRSPMWQNQLVNQATPPNGYSISQSLSSSGDLMSGTSDYSSSTFDSPWKW